MYLEGGTRVCVQKLYIIPRGLCRWCSVVCKNHFSKGVISNNNNTLWECQQLLSEPKELCFKHFGFILRFSYQEPFLNQCYQPREIVRQHYSTKEDHVIARHFFEDVLISNLFVDF